MFLHIFSNVSDMAAKHHAIEVQKPTALVLTCKPHERGADGGLEHGCAKRRPKRPPIPPTVSATPKGETQKAICCSKLRVRKRRRRNVAHKHKLRKANQAM